MIPATRPLLTVTAAGAADGVLLDLDDKAGRHQNLHQWSTWFEAATAVAAATGRLGHESQPLLFGSLYRLASRAGAFYGGGLVGGGYAAPEIVYSRGVFGPVASFGSAYAPGTPAGGPSRSSAGASRDRRLQPSTGILP